jgi:hypothetical protein
MSRDNVDTCLATTLTPVSRHSGNCAAPGYGPILVRAGSAIGELVQLCLQFGDRRGRRLSGEPFLQCLVQPLDFAEGGRVLGIGVSQGDAHGGYAFRERTLDKHAPLVDVGVLTEFGGFKRHSVWQAAEVNARPRRIRFPRRSPGVTP